MTIERWIILTLAIICIFAVNRCQRATGDAQFNMSLLHDTIRHYQNKEGQWIAQVNTLQSTTKQLRDNINELGVNEKALKQQIGSLRNLVSYYRAKAFVRDTIVIVNSDTVYRDSAGNDVRARLFTYSNKWMRINGESTQFSTKIEYDYTIEWELVTYMRRSGFLGLGKATMVSDLKFSDPNIKTQEFKAIEVPYKRSIFEKWWFQFTAGAAGMYLLMRGGGP